MNTIVIFKCSEEILKEVQEACKEEQRSRSSLCRIALKEYCESVQKKKEAQGLE